METKIEATDRLRREGRWAEASGFRIAKLKELRAGGIPRKEATAEAWRLMAQKYPPPPSLAPAPTAAALDDGPDEILVRLMERLEGELFSLFRNVELSGPGEAGLHVQVADLIARVVGDPRVTAADIARWAADSKAFWSNPAAHVDAPAPMPLA